jgi:hypothetical protein
MSDPTEEKKEETKFCRLCGKHKPGVEFIMFDLARMGNILIQIEGCHTCSVVVHNAQVMTAEAIRKAQEQKLKIIQPQIVVPANFKKN